MDAHYQALAKEMVAHCPADFTEAELSARMEDGVSTFSLRCRAPGGAETTPRIGGLSASTIDDALVDLRAAWPKEPWSACTFTLSPDGKFKFDVAYD